MVEFGFRGVDFSAHQLIVAAKEGVGGVFIPRAGVFADDGEGGWGEAGEGELLCLFEEGACFVLDGGEGGGGGEATGDGVCYGLFGSVLVEEPSGAGGGEFLAVGVFGDEVVAACFIASEGVFGEVGEGLGCGGEVRADGGFCGGFGSPLGGVFFAGGVDADGDIFYTAGGGVVEEGEAADGLEGAVFFAEEDDFFFIGIGAEACGVYGADGGVQGDVGEFGGAGDGAVGQAVGEAADEGEAVFLGVYAGVGGTDGGGAGAVCIEAVEFGEVCHGDGGAACGLLRHPYFGGVDGGGVCDGGSVC